MILNLFSSNLEHPLADAKELKRVIGELTLENDFKAVDEVVGWLESLRHLETSRIDKLCEVVRALDEAAQPHIRRLTREYLTSPRLSKAEERRYHKTATDFWSLLAAVYEIALSAGGGKDKSADGLKPFLPLIASRLLFALGAIFKWMHFRYGPVGDDFWSRLGAAYLAAEQGRYAGKAQMLYPGLPGTTTPAMEYLKSLILSASSLDSLQPLEIELAEKLVTQFLPHFLLSAQDRHDNLYWVDPAHGQPPKRLARLPHAAPTIRFVAPGDAPAEIAAMIRTIEAGEVPASLSLGGQYSARVVLAVLRHIANYWAEKPPLRKHQRHPVRSHLFVAHGYETCVAMFSGGGGLGGAAETWVVDNVSMGGFGALVACHHDEWLRIGALLCVQPEGGDNRLLGVVRRYGRESDAQASVGIQTISKQARMIRLRPRGAPSFSEAHGIDAIAFEDEARPGELCVVLPPNTFDMRESHDAHLDSGAALLSPMESLETGPDYEIARYRVRLSA